MTVQIVTLLVGDQEFDSAKTLAAFALGLVLFVVTLVLNVDRAARRAPATGSSMSDVTRRQPPAAARAAAQRRRQSTPASRAATRAERRFRLYGRDRHRPAVSPSW